MMIVQAHEKAFVEALEEAHIAIRCIKLRYIL